MGSPSASAVAAVPARGPSSWPTASLLLTDSVMVSLKSFSGLLWPSLALLSASLAFLSASPAILWASLALSLAILWASLAPLSAVLAPSRYWEVSEDPPLGPEVLPNNGGSHA